MSEYFVGSTGANNQTNFSSLDTSEVLDDLGLNTGDSPTFSGLFLEGSGSTIFSVDGSNGRLFGVTDEVTGTVFSVNDAAGLPIIEVESTSSYDKLTLGEYGSDLLVLSGQNTIEITGSQIASQSWVSDQGFSADTNYYLTGVSKSGNTFTFEVNGASDPTYTLTSGDITGALGYTPVTLEDDGSIEAEEFIGDLRGAVSFKAQAGEAIAKGEAVFISGISGNTTVVALADANDATKMPAFGIASEAASANNPVTVINFGSLGNLDTDTPNWDEGDELFVSNTAGALTTTPPTSESSLLQKIAKVTRRHASSGSITVMGAGRTNAVPNLNEGRLFVGNSSNEAVADDTAYIDIANSRVGIGTTSPAIPLHVKGNIRAEDGGSSAFVDLKASQIYATNAYDVIVGTNNPLHFRTSDTRRMTILGDGKVGIGTTSPSNFTGLSFSDPILDVAGPIQSRTGHVALGGSSYRKAALFTSTGSDAPYLDFRVASSGTSSSTTVRMRIDENGNVGIGTTSPSAPLDISSSATGGTTIELDNTSTGGRNWTLYSSGSGNSFGAGKFALYDADAASVRMLVDTSGNVGIGTTSPASLLHISSSTSGDAVLTIEADTDNNDENDNPYIHFKQDGGGVTAKVGIEGTNGLTFTNSLGNHAYLGSEQNHGVQLYANGAAGLTLRGGGDIGIGTNAPETKLHVYKSSATSGTSTGTSVLRLQNYVGSDLSQQKVFADFVLADDNANEIPQVRIGAEVGQNGDADSQVKEGCGAFVVYTNNADTDSGDAGASLAERMRVDYQGNVGIGTTTPKNKLDISLTDGQWRINDYGSMYFANTSDTGYERYIHSRSDGALSIGRVAIANLTGGTGGYAATTYDHIHINSSGEVGIGTTSPSEKLHVNGIIRTHNSDVAKYINIFGGSSGNFIDTYGNSLYIRYGGDSNKSILLNSAGNVGIGNTNPTAAKLIVRKDDGYAFRTENASGYTFRIAGDTGNIEAAGDLTVSGDLTVNGITSTINSTTISVDDKNIELGSVSSPDTNTADGGGITLLAGSSESDHKTIKWINSTDAWTFSERTAIPDGTAAAPALTFTSDTDTGIYRISADALGITTGGTLRAQFNNTGIVSSLNLYSSSGGEFRNYGGTWQGTTGLTGNGFQFVNSVDGTALTISSTGDTVASGTVKASSYFLGSSTEISLATTGAGSVFLRPNGQSTSGQMQLASTGNATFAGSVTATSLIKSGGSSSEFLKADGSVDSSTYLTTSGKAADSNLLDGIDSTRFIYGGNATGTTSISGSAFNPTGSLKSGFYRVAGTSSTIPNATSVNFVLHTSYSVVGNKAGFDLAVNDSQTSKIYFRPATGGGRGSWQTIFTDQNSSGITTVGTITSGEWNGSVIASAYLDSDTAHLSGTQTFTGAKTFGNITSSGGYKANIAESSDADNITSNNIKYGYLANAASNKPVSGNSQYASVGNITLTHYDAAANDDFYIRAKAYNGNSSWAKIFTDQNSSFLPLAGGTIDGSLIIDTDTSAQPFYITRSGATDQSLKIYVDDQNAIFESIQDETADDYGGFIFNMDAGTTHPYFDVRKNNSTIMRVDGGGNVGIGTTSPAVDLEIKTATNSSSSEEGLRLYNAGGGIGAGVRIGLGVGATYSEKGHIRTDVVSGGAGRLFLGSNGSDRLVINENGKVLVNGAEDNSGKADFAVSGGTVLAFRNNQVQMGGSDMNWNSKIFDDGQAKWAAWDRNIEIFSTGSNTGSATARDIIFSPQTSGSAASTERMRIKGSGNVGIGTSSPNAKLDVNSGISTSSTDVLKLSQATDGAIKAAASLGISIQNGGESTNAADLWFTTATGGSLSERMRITSAGQVLIGRTSNATSQKLQVEGFIDITDVTGSALRWYNGSTFRGGLGLDDWATSGSAADLTLYGTNNLHFVAGGSNNKRMTILSGGNVGIGTTTPSAKLEVNGHFAATTKSFIVDNPKTGGKLQYGVVESDQHSVFVRGKNDTETIELPEEWEWLVDEDSVTVDLTSIGQIQQLFVISQDNKTIKIGGLATNGKYNYTVYGERKDVEKLKVNI